MSTGPVIRSTEQGNDNEDDRKRVSKACSRCRLRKDRCDGSQPCTNCQTANKPCSYEATTKKRGLPEGYVRGFEKLITLACQTIDGLEPVLTSLLKDEELRKLWNTSKGDGLYSSWKDSDLYHQLDGFLRDTASNYSGPKRKRDDDSSESPPELDTVLQQLRANQFRITQEQLLYTMTGQHVTDGQEQTAQPLPTTKLPSNSKGLIDLYFTHVHCWFPILDRPSVLKEYYAYSRRTLGQKQHDGGQALIWAILAYTVQLDADMQDKQALSRRYSEISLKYIPTPYTNAEDVQDFDVMQAQALVILSLLRLGNGQWVGAWMCTGRAVRILLAKNVQAEHSQQRRGAFQGCFILETLLNVHFDNTRPLFLPSLVDHMLDEDGFEEWESWGSSQGPSFARSIFNRLTSVFLILHDALTDNAASMDPSYIQSKLTSIHNLAQEHFNLGIGSPTVESPPHHVYFQIGLLFAQLRLVSRLAEQDAVQFDLMSLTINVLGLFEICEKSVNIGLTRMPPLFADILNLAIDVAAGARISFGSSASSPTYQDFVFTISDFRARLSNIWASFHSRKAISTPGTESSGARRTMYNDDYVVTDVAVHSQTEPQEAFPTTIGTRSTSQIPLAPTQSFFPEANQNALGQGPWSGVDLVGDSLVSGAAFPITSPSFAGDEVDAIFHEMAQLDTSEWANERAMGLKDFGFSDESAFMDFCNDPERLLPVDSSMPLSSNRQSWTFTGQPP
ncbi:hypothetical protein LTS08_001914 [Lithohypha guttulata]|uniref:uncharacterized protein n=1 Tax=Lithohypha guttulata TaxID=1690604 RepID=UPI002DE0CF0A|nr:hypothetical protein LTR51_004573 [Lithohypha guttulata]KAK5104030.1 hypothetical protein LTS08_001914 [Lithohypha guttulata]